MNVCHFQLRNYNRVKFKEAGEIERIHERTLLRNHFNVFRKVTPHKLNYFDFNKPLKVEVKYVEDDDDEDE